MTTPDQETCTTAPPRVTPTTARLGRTSLENNKGQWINFICSGIFLPDFDYGVQCLGLGKVNLPKHPESALPLLVPDVPGVEELQLLDPVGEADQKPRAVTGQTQGRDVVIERQPPGHHHHHRYDQVSGVASPHGLQQGQAVVVVVTTGRGRGRGGPPDLDHLVPAQADQELPQVVGGEVHHAAQVTVQQIPVMTCT